MRRYRLSGTDAATRKSPPDRPGAQEADCARLASGRQPQAPPDEGLRRRTPACVISATTYAPSAHWCADRSAQLTTAMAGACRGRRERNHYFPASIRRENHLRTNRGDRTNQGTEVGRRPHSGCGLWERAPTPANRVCGLPVSRAGVAGDPHRSRTRSMNVPARRPFPPQNAPSADEPGPRFSKCPFSRRDQTETIHKS